MFRRYTKADVAENFKSRDRAFCPISFGNSRKLSSVSRRWSKDLGSKIEVVYTSSISLTQNPFIFRRRDCRSTTIRCLPHTAPPIRFLVRFQRNRSANLQGFFSCDQQNLITETKHYNYKRKSITII